MSQIRTRTQVINLYKNLLFYGREYPAGFEFFRKRLRESFRKNKQINDTQLIEKKLAQGEFVIKELEALYKLKKYRHLKQSYYDVDAENERIQSITNSLNELSIKTSNKND